MPQVGSDHRLYLGYSAMPADMGSWDVEGGTPTIHQVTSLVDKDGVAVGTGDTINTLMSAGSLALFDTIRDLTVGGSNNTVDATTREDARQGFSATIIATSSGEMTVQARYDPLGDPADPATDPPPINHPGLLALLAAFTSKKEIFAIDCDKTIGNPPDGTTGNGAQTGAQGLAGNWSVGFGQPKPVQDIVVIDFQMTLAGKGQWVWLDADAVAPLFKALVTPT